MAGFWNSLVNKIAGVDNSDYYEGDDGIYEDEYEEENLNDLHVKRVITQISSRFRSRK